MFGNRFWQRSHKRLTAAAAAVACGAMLIGVGACGSANSNSADGGDSGLTMDQVNAALTNKKEVELTMWAWAVDQYKPVIDQFEKEYPHIKVNFVESPVGNDLYTKFQNAVSANSNVPDILQVEQEAMPQFAVNKSLANFSSPSIEKDMGALYNDSAWNNAHVADGLYGIPTDQGPTVMFYREDILKQYNIEVPKTWDEYEKAGIALHKADPTKYLGFCDLNDNRWLTNFLSIADSMPWKVEGVEKISFDMQNDKVKAVSEFVQRCIKEGVFQPVSTTGSEFPQALNAGRYATWVDGSWRGNLLETQFPGLSGKWRVALPPQFESTGKTITSSSGGSMLALTAACPQDKRAAAVAFMNWISSNKDAVKTLVTKGGVFSAAKAYQNDSSYEDAKSEYFGGQQVTKTYFESAKALNTEWQNLPFNNEFVTEYNDIVVPTYTNGSSIFGAIGKWQTKLKAYAEEQGFTVS